MIKEFRFDDESEFRSYLEQFREKLSSHERENIEKYSIKDIVDFIAKHEREHYNKAKELGYNSQFYIKCDVELKEERLEVRSLIIGTQDDVLQLDEFGSLCNSIYSSPLVHDKINYLNTLIHRLEDSLEIITAPEILSKGDERAKDVFTTILEKNKIMRDKLGDKK